MDMVQLTVNVGFYDVVYGAVGGFSHGSQKLRGVE